MLGGRSTPICVCEQILGGIQYIDLYLRAFQTITAHARGPRLAFVGRARKAVGSHPKQAGCITWVLKET